MSGFQVMPRLTTEEYEALESDILANGVRVPVTVSADGRIVDGHHRDEVARKHHLHCPRSVAHGTDEELRDLAFGLNLNRRHFSISQRRELAETSLLSDPQRSDRHHAIRAGLSHPTISKIRLAMEADGRLERVTSRLSLDGRERPASKPSRPEVVDTETGELTEAPEPTGTGPIEAPDPTPPAPRKRRPLKDHVRDAAMDLDDALEKLLRLTKDDRFAQNREALRNRIRINQPQLWDQKIQRICDAYGLNRLAELREATQEW